MAHTDPGLPDVAPALLQVLQRVAPAEQPLLIAIAERMAATRYREWAAAAGAVAQRDALLACAAREDEIATQVESLYPDAAAVQQRLRSDHPELDSITRAIFVGRPLEQQYAIQARGERLGAATWRGFAKHAGDEQRRATLLACAELEEASAVVLEALLVG